jgi:hypothetical protein
MFQVRPQNPKQNYCPNPSCQRERRRQWLQDKRLTDPDYRVNQAKAQHNWTLSHPDYWQSYRQTHPEYVERNRAQQSDRNGRRRGRLIAKMNASEAETLLRSGIYRLLPAGGRIAKIDACTVQITLLSGTSEDLADCKETT